MIETMRETIAGIKDALGRLDAQLLAVDVDRRDLPPLPLARGLVELAQAREKLCKVCDRLIELVRTTPPEPQLFNAEELE